MKKINYQDIFQALKGISTPSLTSFVLAIPNYDYALFPICCKESSIDSEVITMLTVARNRNRDSFLTQFTATNHRTEAWITDTVAKDPSKILFAIRHIHTKQLYGYMGLGYGSHDGSYIEGDAVVRHTKDPIPGLMTTAFLALVKWARFELGISSICIRVLADNPAVRFYERCGFRTDTIKDLFMVLDENNRLIELKESSEGGRLDKANKQLAYMKLSQVVL